MPKVYDCSGDSAKPVPCGHEHRRSHAACDDSRRLNPRQNPGIFASGLLFAFGSPRPSSPGPAPPEHVYHYTTGLKLRQIINSGQIKSTTAKIEAHEKPVAWFSTQDQWEPTATKVPIPGMQGQIMTA